MVVVIIIILVSVCCYRRRRRERVKYRPPPDQTLAHSATHSLVSTQSSNVAVRSLEHSPRSSCIMYTTSFTDCHVTDAQTPNHSANNTLNSFTNSNSNALHPNNSVRSSCDLVSSTGDVPEEPQEDIAHKQETPVSYKGHQKRPSYHMMRELCYEDGNIVLAEI